MAPVGVSYRKRLCATCDITRFFHGCTEIKWVCSNDYDTLRPTGTMWPGSFQFWYSLLTSKQVISSSVSAEPWRYECLTNVAFSVGYISACGTRQQASYNWASLKHPRCDRPLDVPLRVHHQYTEDISQIRNSATWNPKGHSFLQHLLPPSISHSLSGAARVGNRPSRP